jgi:O-Antigen ligase
MRAGLFSLSFVAACALALKNPAIGVYAYAINYLVAPTRQWWGEPLAATGARFSLILSLAIAIGMALNWKKLGVLGPFLHSQEKLMWAFVGVVLLSRLWGIPIDNAVRDLSGVSESPAEKMPKVAFFIFMLTHVITKYRQLNWFFWTLIVVGGLYTGFDGYTASPGRFIKGRLNELGGIDFRESSTVAAHLAVVGVITGVYLLKSRNWRTKALCMVTGVFTANAIIQTQTRAALIAIAAGVPCALLLAPRRYRALIGAGLVVGAVGAFSLTNDVFWSRAESIGSEEGNADGWGGNRLEFWETGIRMGLHRPLGIGAGSFYTALEEYDPRFKGRDCHNTFIRCFAELGFLGTIVFGALIVNAFRVLRRVPQIAEGTPIARDVELDCYGLRVALIVYLTAGIFMGLTYVEELWWLLALPVCLERAAISARLEN